MTSLDDVLACPRCGKAPLAVSDGHYRCSGCRTDFDNLEGIPWLFAEPDAAMAEWRHRLQLAVQHQSHESQRIAGELKKNLMVSTRARLERLRDATDQHRKDLLALLAPLDIGSLAASYQSHLALRTRLPSDQGLNTYYNNVHRDWVWGDEENTASLAQVDKVLGASGDLETGVCLVLGAGAGRLAYDLHQRSEARTVALDFNPLLLMIAQRMFAGETLDLHEFPLAPRSADDAAVRQTLSAPAASREGLWPVLADVLRPPFREQSFDTVVTPWLIDILTEDLPTFAARINGLLKTGGRWITFGSLAFEHANRARRYAPDEVLEIVAAAGFDEPLVDEDRIPYMCSPHSRHGRRELVFTFAAKKATHVRSPQRHKALPDWIVTGTEPVPLTKSFQTQVMSTRIHAFIMALIDGKRSIGDMADVLEQQQLMPRSEAVPAIRNFLIRMYEDSQRNPHF